MADEDPSGAAAARRHEEDENAVDPVIQKCLPAGIVMAQCIIEQSNIQLNIDARACADHQEECAKRAGLFNARIAVACHLDTGYRCDMPDPHTLGYILDGCSLIPVVDAVCGPLAIGYNAFLMAMDVSDCIHGDAACFAPLAEDLTGMVTGGLTGAMARDSRAWARWFAIQFTFVIDGTAIAQDHGR